MNCNCPNNTKFLNYFIPNNISDCDCYDKGYTFRGNDILEHAIPRLELDQVKLKQKVQVELQAKIKAELDAKIKAELDAKRVDGSKAKSGGTDLGPDLGGNTRVQTSADATDVLFKKESANMSNIPRTKAEVDAYLSRANNSPEIQAKMKAESEKVMGANKKSEPELRTDLDGVGEGVGKNKNAVGRLMSAISRRLDNNPKIKKALGYGSLVLIALTAYCLVTGKDPDDAMADLVDKGTEFVLGKGFKYLGIAAKAALKVATPIAEAALKTAGGLGSGALKGLGLENGLGLGGFFGDIFGGIMNYVIGFVVIIVIIFIIKIWPSSSPSRYYPPPQYGGGLNFLKTMFKQVRSRVRI